jgi:hypothetical protein
VGLSATAPQDVDAICVCVCVCVCGGSQESLCVCARNDLQQPKVLEITFLWVSFPREEGSKRHLDFSWGRILGASRAS